MGAAACAVALTFTAGAARADDKPMGLWSKAGLDLTWWSAGGIGSSFGFIPFLSYEIPNTGVGLDIDFPFTAADVTADKTARAGFGNPGFGLHYTIEATRRTWVNLGFKLHPPLASVHNDDYRLADSLAAVGSSLNRSPSWLPTYFPMTFSVGLEWNPARPLWIRLLVEPQIYIPTEHNTAQYIQLNQMEMELRADNGFGGGVDVNYLVLATDDAAAAGGLGVGNDHMQISMEPFVGYTDRDFFIRLGLLMALDSPLGFAFDKGATVASPHLTIGGRFD